MNLKRFSIISAIIIGFLIVTLITLSLVRVDNGLKLDDPSKINIYAKSSSSITYSEEETPSKYKKAKSLYEKMTNLSVFDYMLSGKSLKQEPGQDLNRKYDTWSESNKSNFYCFELIFDEKQSVIVSVDGNTKVIEFYALIMKVEKSAIGKEIAVYFSTSTGTSKTYSSTNHPILINANQNKLFNLIDALADKD